MIAVNNRVRKLATSLLPVATAALMVNRCAAFDPPSTRLTFRGEFCCRPKLSVCSDRPEVYLIETVQLCLSSRNRACSTRGSIRACARECRTAKSPSRPCQTSPKGSVVPPGDNGRDQTASRANRKICYDIDHPNLEIVPLFQPLSAEAPV